MSRSSSISTWTRHEPVADAVNGSEDPTHEALRLAELGLLTAGLIHELRQPVFALKALAQLAENHPGRAAEYLGQMLAQVRTMEALLGGYGDFSRRPETRREVFDLRTPVQSALVVLTHRAVAAQVPIELALDVPVAVHGSLLAVQQAVVNLGQNAIDALRGRVGGRLRLTVLATARGGVVRVDDNGPGLPDTIRDRLFEPFRTTKATGTGLGLSISRDLLVGTDAELVLVDDGPGTCWEIALSAPGHG